MSFPDAHLNIAPYLAGDLSPEDRALFEAQLAADPNLRAELDDLRGLWESLGLLTAHDEHPSAALRARFYQRLNSLTRPEPTPSRFRFPTFALQFAGGFALLLIGLSLGRVAAPSSELAQLRAEVRGMRETVALSLLDRSSATARLQGVSYGQNWKDDSDRPGREITTALLSTLNHDSNVNVRLSSVDALQKFADDPAIRTALADALPIQDSPLVQISLIDALVQLHDTDALTQLRPLSLDPHANVNVRQRAKWALQKLQAN